MNDYIAGTLVRQHHAELEREARHERLLSSARAAARGRETGPRSELTVVASVRDRWARFARSFGAPSTKVSGQGA